ncbi:BatD family protein [Leptospira idonii]|uniref:Aerotolerance regulator BatD n=1 Tax=Leptospira idonii TaxID=1193500 RepID=A0A4R9LZD1_9LEPT|nr:BatD family protein [Leptospira idonii]TGN19720.1 hypothetical protein EHS15_08050 [Leptospira idonii]
MKNSGKFFLFFCLFAGYSSSYADEVTFHLTRNQVEQFEDLVLEARVGGDKEFKPAGNSFEKNGAKAVYIGHGSETQIVNFKISRSQILKFKISTNQIGKFITPQIQVIYDGQKYSSPDFDYIVEKGSGNQRTARPRDFFDHFFEDPFREEEPEAKTEVAFHTSKPRVYLGEPVVGYYVLYYNGLRQAYLERDPNQSISFPFFLSETLKQVTVQIDPFAVRKGIEKQTLVYEKEIYGLTPLKTGTFSLGSTKFLVGDSMRFGAIHKSLDVSPARIEVLPLPQGAPNNFKAAVGEYEIFLSKSDKKVHLGETFYFAVQIKGSGNGDGIEDPIRLTNSSVHLVSKSKNKTFKLLPNGEYGFYSELEFFYGIEPEEKGNLNLGTAQLVYFSPASHSYKTISQDLGNLKVLPKRSIPVEKKESAQGDGSAFLRKIYSHWFPLAGLLTLVVVTFGTVLYFRKRNLIKETLAALDEKIGTKRKEILEDYLIRKGISLDESKLISALKDSFPKEGFLEIYSYCNAEDKKALIKIGNQIK